MIAFDRDGVLVAQVAGDQGPRPPWHAGELGILVGAREATQAVADRGYRIAVVTNQPDVARGSINIGVVDEINGRIRAEIPAIERFYVCPHDNEDDCPCRKPRPGMLLEAARDFGANPTDSWMVGDRWTDVAAGRAAGFRTVLILGEQSMRATSVGGPPPDLTADVTVRSIAEAVEAILDYGSG